MIYQYYDPHPKVCKMKQYECCSNYHDTCPLYHICKKIDKEKLLSVCKRDCRTCDYVGCSMSEEKRKSDPLYINGYTVYEVDNTEILLKKEQERLYHRKIHKEQYEMYNKLFGTLNERRRAVFYKKYHEDPEFYINRTTEYYRKKHPKKIGAISEDVMPECKLDCTNCKFEDCILPDNWRRKAYMRNFLERNPNYFAEYREKNRDLLRQKGKEYYETHREERAAYTKAHRSKPEVKEKRAAYDKKYRESHREQINQRRRQWRINNPEKHKEKLARRRQKRKEKKLLKSANEQKGD